MWQARGRYMAHLPNQPPVLRTEQQNKDDFEEFGLRGDMMVVQRRMNYLIVRRQCPALHIGEEWYDVWRWGWAVETWKAFLEPLCPPLYVLCGSFHAQPGLLMAVLSCNEERYGLDRCNMIARSGVVKEEGVRPNHRASSHG